MIDDAAKRVDWGVMLEGDSFDLEDWESALKPSFDPLDPASDSSSAYERRRALIEQINGALAITHGARNLRLDRIVEILSDGTQRRHALLSAAMGRFRLKMRATAEVIGPDGLPKHEPPKQSNPQQWLALAVEVARGEDWFDVWSA